MLFWNKKNYCKICHCLRREREPPKKCFVTETKSFLRQRRWLIPIYSIKKGNQYLFWPVSLGARTWISIQTQQLARTNCVHWSWQPDTLKDLEHSYSTPTALLQHSPALNMLHVRQLFQRCKGYEVIKVSYIIIVVDPAWVAWVSDPACCPENCVCSSRG
jgi:hypothetical protein